MIEIMRVFGVKVFVVIVAAFVFLSASMTAVNVQGAQASQVSETRFEPRVKFQLQYQTKFLQRDLAPSKKPSKKKEKFFVEFGVMGSSGFRQKHGVHDPGYGIFLEGSYLLWNGKYLALRPALELTGIYSLDNKQELNDGTTRKIDVLGLSGHGVIYVDFKMKWRLQPYLGVGGGYNHVMEDGSDNVEDNGGVAVLVGHAGIDWQIQKKGRWFLTFGYSYIFGFKSLFLDTRGAQIGEDEKIAVDSHRIRIGTRVAF